MACYLPQTYTIRLIVECQDFCLLNSYSGTRLKQRQRGHAKVSVVRINERQ